MDLVTGMASTTGSVIVGIVPLWEFWLGLFIFISIAVVAVKYLGYLPKKIFR